MIDVSTEELRLQDILPLERLYGLEKRGRVRTAGNSQYDVRGRIKKIVRLYKRGKLVLKFRQHGSCIKKGPAIQPGPRFRERKTSF